MLDERLRYLATSRSCSGSDSLSVLTISIGRFAGGVGGSDVGYSRVNQHGPRIHRFVG
jgi:hypothetical protein